MVSQAPNPRRREFQLTLILYLYRPRSNNRRRPREISLGKLNVGPFVKRSDKGVIAGERWLSISRWHFERRLDCRHRQAMAQCFPTQGYRSADKGQPLHRQGLLSEGNLA